MIDILSSCIIAITNVFDWFTNLYIAIGALNLVIALVFVSMIYRFLLYPFFSGTGQSDSVKKKGGKK